MNVSESEAPGDEPPMNPGLAALVEHARAQPDPVLTVTFEDVRAAERYKPRTWVAAAAVGLAAIGLAVLALSGGGTTAGRLAAVDEPVDSAVVGVGVASSVGVREPGLVASAATDPPGPSEPVEMLLDNGATVVAHGDGKATATGPHSATLSAGRFQVVTPGGKGEVTLHAFEQVLEVAADSAVTLVVQPERTHYTVERGQVRRGSLPPAVEPTEVVTAGELAKRAESQMTAGRPGAAIRTLSTLVQIHPRTGAARAGLLDLARLRKKQGDLARARCAYRLYLQRWPGSSQRTDVERALARLGESGRCQGLRPVPSQPGRAGGNLDGSAEALGR